MLRVIKVLVVMIGAAAGIATKLAFDGECRSQPSTLIFGAVGAFVNVALLDLYSWLKNKKVKNGSQNQV
jgi:uncharacterized membrane protein YeaQ/YmgE (transglycosylase-associated protein family)